MKNYTLSLLAYTGSKCENKKRGETAIVLYRWPRKLMSKTKKSKVPKKVRKQVANFLFYVNFGCYPDQNNNAHYISPLIRATKDASNVNLVL